MCPSGDRSLSDPHVAFALTLISADAQAASIWLVGLSGRNRYLPAMQELARLWANTWPFLIPVLYFVIGLAFGMLNNPE
jgi:hypothetical protein